MGKITGILCIAVIGNFLLTGDHTPAWSVVIVLCSLVRDLAGDTVAND